MDTEKFHGLLLDNLNAAVLLLDEQLSITYVNSAAESLLQIGSSRLLGSHIYILFNDAESCKKTLEEAIRSGNPHTRRHEQLRILAFNDISPQAAVHVLVIPKGPYVSLDHFARDATPEEQTGFFAAVAEVCVATSVEAGFRAIANTRAHGVQDVPHFHMHIIGGQQLGRMLPK